MSIINDLSFVEPYLIKTCLIFILIGAASIIPNKLTFHEPEDDE